MTGAGFRPAALRSAAARALDLVSLRPQVTDAYRRLQFQGDRGVRERNRRMLARGAPDGLPLPPPRLAYRVTGEFDLERYWTSGVAAAGLIRDLLARHASGLAGCAAVLDFGCGCGRVIRHLGGSGGPRLFGTDRDRAAIAWCHRSLPLASFATNTGDGRLPLPGGRIDLAYAISVFTHLPLDLQRPWMQELARVVRPGGLILLTTHGDSRRDQLPAQERTRFDAGLAVVVGRRYAFSNYCGAFHPAAHVRDVLARGLEHVESVAAGSGRLGFDQDAHLFRVPASGRPA